MPAYAYMFEPPYWPLERVVEVLDDGSEVEVTPCARCGWPTIASFTHLHRPEVRHLGRERAGRGLCAPCYRNLHGRVCARCEAKMPADEYDDFTPRIWPWRQLVEEWRHLFAAGVPEAEIARRLGIHVKTLQVARRKARETDPMLLPPEYRNRRGGRVKATA